MIINWIQPPITLSCVLSQFLWYNSYIKTLNKAVYLKFFSVRNINFITQLFYLDGSFKNWKILKTEYAFQDKDHFSRLQLINVLPQMWKKCIKQTSKNTSWLLVKDQYLLWDFKIIILENLSSK